MLSLSLAITVLFTLTGLIAAATVVHCLIGARAAYVRLMREGEVMRAGFALQAAAVEMRLRPAPRRAIPARRMVTPAVARPACAA
ncbi:MAG: hypothetical protein MUF47_13515 [Porphyrobacter sp.]|jgi:hypothetical protein|nr:hypothetical protein [Porphyrobacter sp.]